MTRPPFDLPPEVVVDSGDLPELDVDILVSASTRPIAPRTYQQSVQMFHGLSFRNRAVRRQNATYSHYMMLGPYMRRTFERRGLMSPGDPRVAQIGFPKTDRLINGTLYRSSVLRDIGFSTAVTRAREAINRQRTILCSHERIGIFRVFGRDAGFTAVYSAYVTGGRCVIPEIEFDLQKLIELLLEDKRNNSSRYAFVIASEGALWKGQSLSEWGEADAYGHKKKADIGLALAEEIRRHTGEDTISSDLTYELRGGEPDLVDYLAGTTFGNIAAFVRVAGILAPSKSEPRPTPSSPTRSMRWARWSTTRSSGVLASWRPSGRRKLTA